MIQSGPDFLGGEHEGVGATIDGQLFLANRNLLPDPSFAKFAPTGGLEDWDPPDFPLIIRGWNVYAAYSANPEIPSDSYELVGSRLPLSRSVFTFNGELGTGAFAPSSAVLPELVAPPPSTVGVIPVGSQGFYAGYIRVAYALIMNALVGPEMRLTPPSPTQQFTLTAPGASIKVAGYIDESVLAQGSAPVGVAIYTTKPVMDLALLDAEPLHLQEISELADTNYFEVWVNGPWRDGESPTELHKSFVGSTEAHDPPRFRLLPVPGAKMALMHLQLTWSFRTASGWSAAQRIAPETGALTLPTRNGVGLAVWAPYRPEGALAWRPEWREHPAASSGSSQWHTYAGSGYGFGGAAYVYTTEPTSGYPGAERMVPVIRSTTDETGSLPPTTAPMVVAQILPGVFEGNYGIRVISLYDEGLASFSEAVPQSSSRSAPSIETKVSITSDQAGGALRVFRPPVGNLIPNPEGRERERIGTPIGWTTPEVAGLSVSFDEGVATGRHLSGSLAIVDALSSGVITLPDTSSPYTLRLKFTTQTQVSGRVSIVVEELDDAELLLSEYTVFTTTTGADLPLTEYRFGPTGADFGMHADATKIRLKIRHEGNAGAGPDLTWQMEHAGIFEGWTAPYKRMADTKGLAPDGEHALDPYPAGGYAVVLQNPIDRPADLAGMVANAFEYYAPYITEMGTDRPLRNLRLPVKPGELYALSVYAKTRGLVDDSAIFRSTFKNGEGTVVQYNEPLATFTGSAALSSDWTRYSATYLAPANAAFIEFPGQDLGYGRVTIMGLQFEKGNEVTAYDPGSLPAGGTGYAIVNIDTGLDNVPNPVRNVSDIRRVQGFELVGLAEAGQVGYLLRSGTTPTGPWSGWTSNPSTLAVDRINRYVQAKLILSEYPQFGIGRAAPKTKARATAILAYPGVGRSYTHTRTSSSGTLKYAVVGRASTSSSAYANPTVT